ncbi:hypothetical protein [Bacillus sp. AK031]
MKVKAISCLLLALFLVFLSACSQGKDEIVWKESVPFQHEAMTLYGTEGKLGIVKLNGKADEPAFPVGEGRHYGVYFLDESMNHNAKKYRMSATHEGTDETIQLYERGIGNNQSGAKFSLDKEGLWMFDVSVDEEPLTSFIIRAEKK